MRVTQTISIGTLRINSMSNSSILQVGTSGAIKAKARETTEVIPQAEANKKLESQIIKSVTPLTDKEGIPTEQETQTPGAGGATGGTTGGTTGGATGGTTGSATGVTTGVTTGSATGGTTGGATGGSSGGSSMGNENGKPDGMAEGDYNYGNGSRRGNRKNRT